MKVLNYYPVAMSGSGAVASSVLELSRALASRGEDTTVLFDEHIQSVDPGVLAPLRTLGLAHVGRGNLRFPIGMRHAVASQDVILLNSAWTAHNAVAARTCRRADVPYVLCPRGAYHPQVVRRGAFKKRVWWRGIDRAVIAGAAAVHIFFSEEADHLSALGYNGRLLVAPNSVSAPPGCHWDGGSGGYLLYLGRLDVLGKGLDALLEAVAQIDRAARPSVRLIGPDHRGSGEQLRRLLSDLDLFDTVSVEAPLQGAAKWEAMCSALALVYPSRWEAFGRSVAEAAAIGLPSIVGEYPLGRLLAAHNAALLAPTSKSLAETIAALDDVDLEEVSKNARRIAHEEFSERAVADAWRTQLASIIDR